MKTKALTQALLAIYILAALGTGYVVLNHIGHGYENQKAALSDYTARPI